VMPTDRSVGCPVARIPGRIPSLSITIDTALVLPTFNVTKGNPRSSHNRNSECFLLSEKKYLFPKKP